MIIPDEIRKCVAFVGYQMADGTFRMGGSAFFIGKPCENGKADPVYWVTARHVIDGIRNKGLDKICIRANTKEGKSMWIASELSQWFWSQEDQSLDVAILRAGIWGELDHQVIPYTLCATEQVLKKHEVALGDEVFITGLFRHHHGEQRNIPIARVGNLASMTEDKIVTKDFGGIDAFLIEARSIGGLSGSPVFLNLGIHRFIGGKLGLAPNGPIFFLLGLIHGHFDSVASSVDELLEVEEDTVSTERVNTGIAIVVPFASIMKTINEYEANKILSNAHPTPP